MRYDLYLELKNFYGTSFPLTASECQKIQSAFGVTPMGKRGEKIVSKTTSDGRYFFVKAYGTSDSSDIDVGVHPTDGSRWNSTFLEANKASRKLFGNIVDAEGGVYYFDMKEGEPLKIRYYDKETFDTIKSLGVTDEPYTIDRELKRHGIIPDLEGEVKVATCAEAIALIEKGKIEFCKQVVAAKQSDSKGQKTI